MTELCMQKQFKLLYIFLKKPTSDVWQGSKYNQKTSSTCIQNGSKTIFEGYVMLLYTNDAGTQHSVYRKEYLVVHCKKCSCSIITKTNSCSLFSNVSVITEKDSCHLPYLLGSVHGVRDQRFANCWEDLNIAGGTELFNGISTCYAHYIPILRQCNRHAQCDQ